jgi:hypothetical protein
MVREGRCGCSGGLTLSMGYTDFYLAMRYGKSVGDSDLLRRNLLRLSTNILSLPLSVFVFLLTYRDTQIFVTESVYRNLSIPEKRGHILTCCIYRSC